ncbi:hypothetical protein ElyMa_006815800 [Elysia marginata]|uniref:Uncharacterized protein n=1 Tax=Elysia marginata TaxID=1093978 RepID=A0AAV4J4B6_9GAST|nr:hypothetical protein ElyMa_006815800 [Elysia marginata]
MEQEVTWKQRLKKKQFLSQIYHEEKKPADLKLTINILTRRIPITTTSANTSSPASNKSSFSDLGQATTASCNTLRFGDSGAMPLRHWGTNNHALGNLLDLRDT